MKESKLYSEFQRLGKVLMAPVLLLPVSGILVGLGSALSNANLISLCPLLGTEPMVIFSTLIKAAGNVINGNISVLFAICIAYGYAKAEKATAALSGFIGYMTMNTIMGQLLILHHRSRQPADRSERHPGRNHTRHRRIRRHHHRLGSRVDPQPIL